MIDFVLAFWIPSWELTYSLPAGTFESMIFPTSSFGGICFKLLPCTAKNGDEHLQITSLGATSEGTPKGRKAKGPRGTHAKPLPGTSKLSREGLQGSLFQYLGWQSRTFAAWGGTKDGGFWLKVKAQQKPMTEDI